MEVLAPGTKAKACVDSWEWIFEAQVLFMVGQGRVAFLSVASLLDHRGEHQSFPAHCEKAGASHG